jgi:RNA polymerase sigma-70 factor (ECF subfamily)
MESDEALMVAVARGDERALLQLVDRHAGRIHRFLARMSADAAEAEDLLQETWIRIVRSADSFDPSRRFQPWAFRIAGNLARDYHRRRLVRNRGPEPASTRASQLDPLERMDLRARIAALPERLREVLVLRYYEGMSEVEMAEALAIPRGTVKSRLHHAMRGLRRGYQGDGE